MDGASLPGYQPFCQHLSTSVALRSNSTLEDTPLFRDSTIISFIPALLTRKIIYDETLLIPVGKVLQKWKGYSRGKNIDHAKALKIEYNVCVCGY